MRLRSLPSLLLLVAAVAMVGIFLFLRPVDPPPTPLVVVPSPDLTGPDTALPRLHATADGALHLTYTGPAPAGSPGPRALFLRTRAAPAAAWSAPRVITATPLLMENWADFPSLTVGTDGQLWAHWFQNRAGDRRGYDGWLARSTDAGLTWSEPAPLGHEFVSLAPLSGGRVLAVWLQAVTTPRAARAPGDPAMELHGRLLAPDGAALGDWLIDPDVCTCCQTALVVLPGDEALVAYRSRRAGEIRDHHTARFTGTGWTNPNPLPSDGWSIAGCPVNGPALSARGTHVVAAWFTAADGFPRVRAAFSTDAGDTWGPAHDLATEDVVGRVDVALLADGAAAVTWLRATPPLTADELVVTRLTPAGTLSATTVIAPSTSDRASGFPRLARLPTDDLLLAHTDLTGPRPQVNLTSLTLHAPAAPQSSAVIDHSPFRPGRPALAAVQPCSTPHPE